MTEGYFKDPRGFICLLRGNTPEEFRVLVTRKLAHGWTAHAASPAVVPLTNEHKVAMDPPKPVVSVVPAARREPLVVLHPKKVDKD